MFLTQGDKIKDYFKDIITEPSDFIRHGEIQSKAKLVAKTRKT